ncbi:hypothetical protein LEN26_011903 [Aphanomyces euteiches]|nr:hypothetical protein LEN26_011903 [Aphanomyces euteiches]KAH9127577.1 hypothetical protein AeMF1_002141 [Aphanomyces euteiches]KAH9183415.1 hypothetical protein AeNC1_014608 [Aphanomyces euteiches]
MAGESNHIGSYTPTTGFVFLFNLIVGTGALTIPHAFAQVGILYSTAALFLLSVVSYISGTYVIEAIAGVNALHSLSKTSAVTNKRAEAMTENITSVEEGSSEAVPFLVHTEDTEQADEEYVSGLHFDLSKKLEMAAIAHEVFSARGLMAFYACVIAYLYGDLAIYAVAIPKSLREVICPRPSSLLAESVWDCPGVHMNSAVLYRVLVALFGCMLGPFAMGHMQKTAFIQIATTVMRQLSFALMIILACVGIAQGQGRSVSDVVAHENISFLPNFFGICIYSFMCHHSLPGIIAPVSKKRSVGFIFAAAFIAVFVLYNVLSFSATFRYQPGEIQDVYTLNFVKYPNAFIAYFLSLFPVFTLSTSFPIIAITLRENLRTLFHANTSRNVSDLTLFGLLAIAPPLVVALCTEDVGMLVGITGAYAGLGIQWIIPACFVYCLRQRLVVVQGQLKLQGTPRNPYASSFGGFGWLAFLAVLSGASLILITYTRVFH